LIIPKKSLGQNFLIDKNIIIKIINLLKIKNKIVVEIGPGLGQLTKELIKKKPKKLIIIEKDEKLYLDLCLKFNKEKNIKIINKDILKFDFNHLNKAIIVSNLPYNLSTKIILKLLKLNKNIDEMFFMIQKELSEKMNYRNGKINKYKFLTQLSSKYKVYFKVSSNVFYPKPKVQSAVVGFKLKKTLIDWKKLELFINMVFNNNRKKIKNKITINQKYLKKYNDKRVEELNFFELVKIYKFF
tara:strand:+ start:202 stop:927 length:726 start_codon:yes stop_codon:yes gene_type:complete